MNSILTYIAGLLVVLLFAALVGPSLVDWNQFREEIEAQASEAAGRPVSIDGDIRFRILPAPHLTLGKIKVGQNPEADSLPSDLNFVTFAEIDGEVALAPLLSGDIEITSVRIVEPEFNLEVLPDGSGNWRGITLGERMPEEGMFSLASISLEKASFVNGTVNYRNRLNGRRWKAKDVSGEVVATSLLGPLRSELTATVDGIPVAVRIGLGSFAAQKAFRVTTEVDFQGRPLTFLFSGVATEFSLAARLDGNARFDFADGSEKTGAMRADAGMVIDARQATLRNVAIAMGGTTLGGSAEVSWERDPVFSARFSSESFTLDPLLDRIEQGGDETEKSAIERLLPVSLPANAEGDVSVETGVLRLRGSIVRDAKLAFSLAGGVVTVEEASGTIGGPTSISVRGALRPDDESLRFEGEASLASANLRGLRQWIAESRGQEHDETAGAVRGYPFAARAALHLAPGEYEISEIEAVHAKDLSAPQLRGNVSYRSGGARPAITATLEAGSFNVDPLLDLLPEDSDPFAFLDAHDVALNLKAEQLDIFGQSFRQVETEMSLDAGKLTVADLKIGDAAGARLTFGGELTGVTTGKREDVRGAFTSTIEAERFGGLLEAGGIDVPDVEGPVSLVVTGASGEADDSMSRVDTLTLKGAIRGSRVDGVLKRLHEGDDGIDKVEMIGNAVNEEGRILLEQLGLSPREGLAGSGAVSVKLSGAQDEFETNFRVNVDGTTLAARGKVRDPFEALKFEGRAEIAASGVMHVLGSFGAPGVLADWASAQAAGPGFVFSSNVVWDKTSLTLDGFEGVAGSFRVSGDAIWRAGEGDKLPVLTGTFESNAVDLTPLVEVSAAEEGVWPARALDWSPLGAFDADADLKLGRLSLGSLSVSNVTTHVSVSHGVLTASPFAGEFADGRISAGARIEGGDGEPGVGITVLVEEASLGKAFSQAFGASPGSGRLSLNAQLQGQGRSWLALVSSADGIGKFDVMDAAFRPFDLESFSEGLAEIQTIDAFPALVSGRLWQAETPARGIGGDFVLEEGAMSFADSEIELDGGMAKINAAYDLTRLSSKADMTVAPALPEGAPSFRIVARGKAGSMEVEADTNALQDFVAKRILTQSLEETGAEVPEELRDLMELPPSGDGKVATPLPRPSVAN
ncbi:MAG: hypothetical protein AMXMBFR74_13930 [Parvibaculum sp.]|uniref:AsmA family protein n=1 Tax=Parvibaculum sp. TaxID=2024848 RepID=UPI0035B8BB26